MKSHVLGALLCLAGTAFAAMDPARAALVVEEGKVAVAPANVPQPARGSLMKAVEKAFGAPAARHPTVGKPPITRWDYPSFSVFFEGDRVIDTVATGS